MFVVEKRISLETHIYDRARGAYPFGAKGLIWKDCLLNNKTLTAMRIDHTGFFVAKKRSQTKVYFCVHTAYQGVLSERTFLSNRNDSVYWKLTRGLRLFLAFYFRVQTSTRVLVSKQLFTNKQLDSVSLEEAFLTRIYTTKRLFPCSRNLLALGGYYSRTSVLTSVS